MFLPFFSMGSSKPRKKGTTVTDQTHNFNIYIKDVRQQETSQPKALPLGITPELLQNYKHEQAISGTV